LTAETPEATVGVTVKAVNHRYLDVQVRAPTSLAAMEPRLRALVQQRVARGRVELTIAVVPRMPAVPDVELNGAFVARLASAFETARQQGLVDGALTPGDLLRLPQALVIRSPPWGGRPATAAALSGAGVAAVGQALADLDLMRRQEGLHLKEDLDERCRTLAAMVERIVAAADAGSTTLQERLRDRIAEIAGSLQLDPQALAQEVVRFAQRSDITEEVVRLRSHLTQWAMLVDAPDPCGRKLDFLVQEMNREVNTIGSKADGPGVSELVVDAKAELERIREQVQNVE
jgi:uncharacterized protein (TIGR00255 family)